LAPGAHNTTNMPDKCPKFLSALIFSALAVTAIIFSCLAVASCEFIKYTDPAADAPDGATLTAGLFKFEVADMGECVTYSESEVESLTLMEKTAMVCGFLAPCIGILGLALATLELFLCDRCCVGCIVSVLFAFATIAQSLTFMFLRSDSFCSVTSCTVGAGGIYSIVAVSVLCVTGCTLGCIPKSEPLLTRGKGGD